MTIHHAALWLGHDSARILWFDGRGRQFDPACYRATDYAAPALLRTGETEHTLHGDLCDAMRDIPALLVTGCGTRPDDFLHYVRERRPEMLERIVGLQQLELPAERRLMALAWWHFSKPADALAQARPWIPMPLALPH